MPARSSTDPELPRITAAEWAVAESIWSAGRPLSSTEIVERLSVAGARHPKTVRTLLDRLVRKKVVATERRDRTTYFFPRLSRTEYVSLETRSLLDRIFGGRRGALLLHLLIDAGDLSPADIAVLRERLAEIDAGRPPTGRTR